MSRTLHLEWRQIALPRRKCAEISHCFSVFLFGICECGDGIAERFSEAECHVHFCFYNSRLIFLSRVCKRIRVRRIESPWRRVCCFAVLRACFVGEEDGDAILLCAAACHLH